jgi:hypothetical protein
MRMGVKAVWTQVVAGLMRWPDDDAGARLRPEQVPRMAPAYRW